METADGEIAGLGVFVALEMGQHLSIVIFNLVRHQEWLFSVLIKQLNHSVVNFKHMLITRGTP